MSNNLRILERNFSYDLLIIGGGISACVFASKYLQNNISKKIALIEAGRGLDLHHAVRVLHAGLAPELLVEVAVGGGMQARAVVAPRGLAAVRASRALPQGSLQDGGGLIRGPLFRGRG